MAKQTPITPWFGIPNNRQEALRHGQPAYFTGKPCIHGHLSNRNALDRKCQQCDRIAANARGKDPAYQAKNLKWNRANKDKRRASSVKSKIKHAETVKIRMREYNVRNRAIIAQKRSVWVAANKAKILALNAARRFRECQATPPWAARYQAEFEAIYAERQRLDEATGIKHHVDHIYPLKGKTSCGLHVPWNLRIITATENIKKRNSPPDESTIKHLTGSGFSQSLGDSGSNAAGVP